MTIAVAAQNKEDSNKSQNCEAQMKQDERERESCGSRFEGGCEVRGREGAMCNEVRWFEMCDAMVLGLWCLLRGCEGASS